MGASQSLEEVPYHRQHYNATNQHLQRQNSLRSMSTPNLLLQRDPSTPQRTGSFYSPTNSPAASTTTSTQQPRPHQPSQRRASFASSIGSFIASTGSFTGQRQESTTAKKSDGAGNPTTTNPILRLLPIQSNPIYYDETDDSSDDDTDSENDKNGADAVTKRKRAQPQPNRGITASPSYLDQALNVNTRSSRSDSLEHHPRDKAELHRSKAEEQEDLAHLSPTSGVPALDHNHPQYFDDERYGQGEEIVVVKRYQLYDPPVPTGLFSSMNNDTENQDGSSTHQPQALQQLSQSLPSRTPLFLDIIREEDEEGGHSRRPSQINQDSDSDSDYKDDDDSEYDMMEISRIGTLSQPPHETNHTTHATQPTVEELFGEVRTDLDKRIQQAVQQVEQQLADRVQRLEQTAHKLSLEQGQDLGQSLLDAQPNHRHARETVASNKEILSNTSHHVEDLDTRVNAMEYLVSFKLNDIESKVQELHEGHGVMAQSMQEAGISSDSNPFSVLGGKVSNEVQRYHQPLHATKDDDDLVDMDGYISSSTSLIDRDSIMELRQELQGFGMRYHELNDGLLTDLMTQLREAKLMLYENVDQVDQRLGRRADRVEAEIHAKRLSDIENRIQERVRAMEQTSTRLEQCFDKMEGRLGAIETVLSSKRPRPESMYLALQQQHQQQQRSDLPDRKPSPESPRPTRSDENAAFSLNSSLKATPTPLTLRGNAPRPLRIQTCNSVAGPHSAGPSGRTRQRAMTIDGLSSPSVGSGIASFTQSLVSIGAAGPKSAGFVTSASINKPPPKIIRRPSSYKELLHFWKAGGSSPDLLKGTSTDS